MFYFSAVKAGTEMLELDVFLSKDKQIVVSHDEKLDRLCDSDGLVSDYDYEVILFTNKNKFSWNIILLKSICCKLVKQCW